MTTTLDRTTPADVEAFGAEMDAIRAEVIASLGADDAAYVRRVIALQRRLELTGRATLLASAFPPAWIAGTAALSVAKVLENMEIGHNVLHGQWDWMRDPEIHSTTWEWDNVSASEGWKHSHNDLHHTWTNVVGRDRDVGYTIMRMSEDQRWHPVHLLQPAFNVALALLFQWGIAAYDLELDELQAGRRSWADIGRNATRFAKKASKQVLKDYVVHPLLSGPSFVPTLTANMTANVVRNVWSNVVIFCGHFPDGAEMFTVDDIKDETRGGWYVRQLLGSANIDGGPLMHLMTGNLSFQIEHHLFPDLPSNRYAEIAPKVRAACERYGLPYTSGPLHQQYASTWKRVLRLALPPKVTPSASTSPAPQQLAPAVQSPAA